MTMGKGGGGMEVPITIKARDQASATMSRIGKQAQNLNQQVAQSGRSANVAGLGMMGLSRGLGMMGAMIAPLLGAAGLAAVTKTMEDMRQSAITIQTQLKGLGEEYEARFTQFQETGWAEEMADNYGRTTEELNRALVNMMMISTKPDITFREMEAVLAGANLYNISLEEMAIKYAQAMMGNIEPMIDIMGRTAFEGLEEFQALVLEEMQGKNKGSWQQHMGADIKNTMNELASGDIVSALGLDDLGEQVVEALDLVNDLLGLDDTTHMPESSYNARPGLTQGGYPLRAGEEMNFDDWWSKYYQNDGTGPTSYNQNAMLGGGGNWAAGGEATVQIGNLVVTDDLTQRAVTKNFQQIMTDVTRGGGYA